MPSGRAAARASRRRRLRAPPSRRRLRPRRLPARRRSRGSRRRRSAFRRRSRCRFRRAAGARQALSSRVSAPASWCEWVAHGRFLPDFGMLDFICSGSSNSAGLSSTGWATVFRASPPLPPPVPFPGIAKRFALDMHLGQRFALDRLDLWAPRSRRRRRTGHCRAWAVRFLRRAGFGSRERLSTVRRRPRFQAPARWQPARCLQAVEQA